MKTYRFYIGLLLSLFFCLPLLAQRGNPATSIKKAEGPRYILLSDENREYRHTSLDTVIVLDTFFVQNGVLFLSMKGDSIPAYQATLPAGQGGGGGDFSGLFTDLSFSGTTGFSDLVDNVDDADANPTNEIQTISKAGNTVTLSNGGGSFTDAVDDADASTANELQTISKAGNTVTLSKSGGSFTDAVDDADADPSNEIQTISWAAGTGGNDELSLSNGGGTVTITDNVDDSDADPVNELQGLTWNNGNRTLALSNGGGTVTITDAVDDSDADPSNEIQTISKAGNTVTLSNGGGSFTDAVDDADADPANELQTISKVGSTVTLSNAGGSFTDAVDDADANPGNELQTLDVDFSGDFLTFNLTGSAPTFNTGMFTSGDISGNGSQNNPLTVDFSGILAASNGLNIDGVSGNVELGGALIENTNIDAAGFNFNILSGDNVIINSDDIRLSSDTIAFGLNSNSTTFLKGRRVFEMSATNAFEVYVPNSTGGFRRPGVRAENTTNQLLFNSMASVDTFGFIRPGTTLFGTPYLATPGYIAYNPTDVTLAVWDGTQFVNVGNNPGGGGASFCEDCVTEVTSTNSILIGEDARSTLDNEIVQAGGGPLEAGHHQFRQFLAWKDHTGTGTIIPHVNGTNQDLVIPNNTIWAGQCNCLATGTVAGGSMAVGDYKFYSADFVFRNIAGSVNIVPVDTTDPALDSPSFGSSSMSLLSDQANNALIIFINSPPGAGGSKINLTCTVSVTETKW